MAHASGDPLKVAVVTLGCSKNLVDSEHMLGLLQAAGFRVEAHQAEPDQLATDLPWWERLPDDAGRVADLCVVNTCGFIDAAKEESVGVLLRLARLKEEGRLGALVAAGCLAQRYAGELMAEIPELDAAVGTGEFGRIVEVTREAIAGLRPVAVAAPVYRYDQALPRLRLTPPYTAYLKIAEGCDHTCAFCIIPRLRGAYRSRPLASILEEARALVASGVVELNLISQDCTRYGFDLEGGFLLPRLLEGLAAIDGIRWIRLLYNYPTTFTPELARAMADLPQVAPYVDIPLQHGSDRILAAMKRGGGRSDLLTRLARLRDALPDATFRSTFITGFPGEGEAEFRELLSFLTEIAFDYVGFFTYSDEEGTAAYGRPEQVSPAVREARGHTARVHQEAISRKRLARHAGRVLEVLVEASEPGQSGFYRGRWQGQAPEVDGQVLFRLEGEGVGEALVPGTIVPVLIERTEEYDLLGRVIV